MAAEGAELKRSMLLPALFQAGFTLAWGAEQQQTDPILAAEIARIQAIDDHSHGEAASPPGDEPQDPTGSAPFAYPVRLRPGNSEYVEAWRALWGDVPVGGDGPRAALRAKWRLRAERAEAYPAGVLDKAGIEVALINAERLGPGQSAPRFRWVPTADDLLFPLQNQRPPFRRMLTESALNALPPTLSQYFSAVITPTLERWKAGGALAIKLAVAYRRPLDFDLVTKEDAEAVYASASADAVPAAAQYKRLQDYLFRSLCAEAGRVGLVVQIHTGVGANPFFNVGGSRPMLLEPAVNDPALRQTRFVLVHGGWPFDGETGVMLMKPNVYADFSAQTFLRSTDALAQTLRRWLEWYPEKVLFGSDAYPESLMGVAAPLAGWEEKTWLSTRTARQALTLALTGMMRDGQITRSQALDLARLVLRGNAERLYGLQVREP